MKKIANLLLMIALVSLFAVPPVQAQDGHDKGGNKNKGQNEKGEKEKGDGKDNDGQNGNGKGHGGKDDCAKVFTVTVDPYLLVLTNVTADVMISVF